MIIFTDVHVVIVIVIIIHVVVIVVDVTVVFICFVAIVELVTIVVIVVYIVIVDFSCPCFRCRVRLQNPELATGCFLETIRLQETPAISEWI